MVFIDLIVYFLSVLIEVFDKFIKLNLNPGDY